MALRLIITLFKPYSRSIDITSVKMNVVADDYVLSTMIVLLLFGTV